ncbi:MAG: AMP-dependent synthetase/ligase [Gemmataceae bacterium]
MEPRNLSALFHETADRLGPNVALRTRRLGLYQDRSWSEYLEMVRSAAAALIDAGVQPGDRVGVLADNRVEWLVADMAILCAGAVNVPPHAPLPAAQVEFQFAETQTCWLFAANAAQLAKVNPAALPHLRGAVVFDPAPGALSWRAFLQRGRAARAKHAAELDTRIARVGPDDLATIMYTSGTTGNPKGVMLTHGNLLSNALSCHQAARRGPDSVLFNWLPFSHIYARTVDHYLSLVTGAALCLAENVDTLVRDLMAIQPTHLSSVPRFYEKLLASVAVLPDDIARKKLHAIFGPRMDWLGSGGAPLPPFVANAFARHGLLILQGYGLTESSPVISFNRKEAYKLESVGQAIPGVEVKIADDGEVLTRGPHVMRGYWKNAQATEDAIHGGWLHTGDLGRLDDDGFLFITGRKKELLVLSSGKKLIPNQVEALLLEDPCVDQAVVHGEGRSFLTALIVPNWTNLRRESGIEGAPTDLAGHDGLHAFLLARFDERLKDLAPWERVKRLVLAAEAFSVANDELTVSLKLRRGVIFQHYRAELERLYQ